MVEKITYSELKAMLMDPSVPDSNIAPYLKARPSESGPFDPSVVPDPSKVEMTPEGEFDVESHLCRGASEQDGSPVQRIGQHGEYFRERWTDRVGALGVAEGVCGR